MFQYRKYNIRETDQFRPDDFPKVLNELTNISCETAGLPAVNKGDIVISFLKEHSLTNNRRSDNPLFADLITSGQFATTHMQALFECCKINPQFSSDLEEFIRKSLY